MNDIARLTNMVDELKKKSDGVSGELTVADANKMLLLSECISSFLQSFSIRHKIGGRDEAGKPGD